MNAEAEVEMYDWRSDRNCRSNRSSDICGGNDIKVFKEIIYMSCKTCFKQVKSRPNKLGGSNAFLKKQFVKPFIYQILSPNLNFFKFLICTSISL